jgi:hypothetical protein
MNLLEADDEIERLGRLMPLSLAEKTDSWPRMPIPTGVRRDGRLQPVRESDDSDQEEPQGMVAAMMQLQQTAQPAAASPEDQAVMDALAMVRGRVAARGRKVNLR